MTRQPLVYRRTLSVLLALLALLAALPWQPASAQEPQVDRLPLWELKHERGTVYLLGSVHLLRPDVYPLDARIYEAFDAAELVVYELDPGEAASAAPLVLRLGMLTDERTLRDVLPAELWSDLEKRVAAFGVPAQAFLRMKPWVAAMTLSSLVLQQHGFEAEWGIELHFYERGRAADKQIAALETAEEQFRILDGLSPEAQLAMMRQTLDELDDAAAQLDTMTALWRRGDADGLAALLNESLGDQPELRERLLLQRNRGWLERIESFLARPGTTMVIAGMGHMVGEGSVIELLRGRGHEVRRVERPGAGPFQAGWTGAGLAVPGDSPRPAALPAWPGTTLPARTPQPAGQH